MHQLRASRRCPWANVLRPGDQDHQGAAVPGAALGQSRARRGPARRAARSALNTEVRGRQHRPAFRLPGLAPPVGGPAQASVGRVSKLKTRVGRARPRRRPVRSGRSGPPRRAPWWRCSPAAAGSPSSRVDSGRAAAGDDLAPADGRDQAGDIDLLADAQGGQRSGDDVAAGPLGNRVCRDNRLRPRRCTARPVVQPFRFLRRGGARSARAAASWESIVRQGQGGSRSRRHEHRALGRRSATAPCLPGDNAGGRRSPWRPGAGAACSPKPRQAGDGPRLLVVLPSQGRQRPRQVAEVDLTASVGPSRPGVLDQHRVLDLCPDRVLGIADLDVEVFAGADGVQELGGARGARRQSSALARKPSSLAAIFFMRSSSPSGKVLQPDLTSFPRRDRADPASHNGAGRPGAARARRWW